MNEAGANLGRAIGLAIARARAQHQQEKNDLTAVVYCRQNPTGSWTFPNKAPMPCDSLAKNVVAYCTVNRKTALCKDVAKLPPPVSAPVAAAEPKVQPQAKQASATTPPVQNLAVSQPQPQAQPQPQVQPQTQMVDVSATPDPEEISVAEAARRNKAAKAAEKAKENPQPQPQQ
jgi:hypothetical protein